MKHIHIAPHALRAAAIFSILTRLKESKKQGMDLVKKMRMYDGEEVEGFKEADLKEMQNEYPEEGMTRHRSALCHQPDFQRADPARSRTASMPWMCCAR